MSPSSSPFFILAAVVVPDDRDADLRAERDKLCVALDRPIGTVLHWAENIKRHEQRKFVASALGSQDYVTLSYVIVDKARLRASGGAQGLKDHTAMYNYAIRRLLERLSWLIRDSHGEAILTFAAIRRFPYHRLTDYLDLLKLVGTTIHWPAFRGDPRILQQNQSDLLQVADIAAGILSAAIVPDRFGDLEPTYLARVRDRIYRRGPAAITSYGMNVVGDSHAPASFTACLPWWSSLFP